MAGTSGSKAGLEEGLNKDQSDEIACPRCTFLNDTLATVCAMCEGSLTHTNMTSDAYFGYVSGDDDGDSADDDDGDDDDEEILLVNEIRIRCQICTYVNKVGSLVCVACHTPLIRNNSEGIMVCARPSSSQADMDSTVAKFSCENCTFVNDLSAATCTCCDPDTEFKKLTVENQLGLDDFRTGSDPPGDHLIECETCKEKFGYRSSGHELANCNHGFCRPCLRTAVVKNLLDLVEADETDQFLSNYERALRCPVGGCDRALSRRDLQLVVGPSIQSMLDNWLMTVITKQVLSPLVRLCPKCKNQLLVPPDQFHLLHLKALNEACTHNLFTLLPGMKKKKVLVKKTEAPFYTLCSMCCFSVCQICGTAPEPSTAHQCDPLRRQCSDITRAIMKLCFAYIQAMWGSVGRTDMQEACSNVRFLSSASDCSSSTQSQDVNGIFFNTLLNCFSVKDFEDMAKVQSSASPIQMIHESYRRPSQKGTLSLVDKLAQSALKELTGIILQALIDNKGVLPPLVVALLCSHDLPHMLLKWLVSHDSIKDITDRCDLYCTLLAFLGALSRSWDLLPLLCSHGAKHDCFATQHRCQRPGSIMSDFDKLVKQAQFLLHTGGHLLIFDNQEIKGPEDSRKEQLEDTGFLLSSLISMHRLLCERIMKWEGKTLQHPWSDRFEQVATSQALTYMEVDQHQYLQNLAAKLTLLSSNGTSLQQAEAELDSEQVEAYKKALKPLQFDEAALLPTHYFRYQVTESEALRLNKARSRAISEELTNLNNILPLAWESSIFVRVDEQRSDVLRALIIGPEGTPYENGVFLFDLLLPHSYPDTPPKVQFLTTGGGCVRFNPNLYDNGMVCLSLLGTWEGPGWIAGMSSIMQVLVSIQGLILVADPFFNEPGTCKDDVSRYAADIYLRQQRLNTVRYSILFTLQCPDPIFLPVIRTHFRLKSAHLLRQCTTWMQEDDGAADLYTTLIEQLRGELVILK